MLAVVAGAADVLMGDRVRFMASLQRFLVEIVFQDGLDAPVTDPLDHERPFAGRFQAVLAEAFTKREDAQTGAEAVLGEGPAGEDLLNCTSRGRSRFVGPRDEALRRSLGELKMGFRHMLGAGRVFPLQ